MRDWRDSYDDVRVWVRSQAGTDPMGEPAYEWTFSDVRGVSVRTCTARDDSGGGEASDLRPDGVRVTYTLAFPRGHSLNLRGARVTLLRPERGMDTSETDGWRTALVVSGDPRPQVPCTTKWDTIAEVGVTDG